MDDKTLNELKARMHAWMQKRASAVLGYGAVPRDMEVQAEKDIIMLIHVADAHVTSAESSPLVG